MVKVKNLLVVCLVISLLMMLVVGCANQNQNDNQNQNTNKNNVNANDDNANNNKNNEEDKNNEVSNFNESDYPIVNESVTLDVISVKWPNHADFNDMDIVKETEELTNVHINWELVPGGPAMEEKVNLLFASNDLPDIFFNSLSAQNQVTYGSVGQLVALNDLIESYAPNVKNIFNQYPIVKNSVTTPDGNIYALFLAQSAFRDQFQNKLMINKVWLDELGLEMPTNTEEFYQVLKEFKEKDANGNGDTDDEIPFSIEPYRFSSFFAPFGITGDYTVKDGSVTIGYVQDAYKEGLIYLNRMFEEGLLDTEIFTQQYSQLVAKASADEMILGAGQRSWTGQLFGQNMNNYTYVPPLEGPDGIKKVEHKPLGYLLNGRFAITASNPYPEVSIRWVDYLYSYEGSLKFMQGTQDLNWKYNDDGKGQLLDTPEGMSYAEFRQKNCPDGASPAALGFEGRELFGTEIDTLLDKYCEETYLPIADEIIIPGMIYSVDDTERLAELQTTIHNYKDEMTAKFIVGEKDIEDEWDSYIETLNKMGFEEMAKIVQDRYTLFIQN